MSNPCADCIYRNKINKYLTIESPPCHDCIFNGLDADNFDMASKVSIITSEDYQSEIMFVCDRRACAVCSYPECYITKDIDHAVNFTKDGLGNYIEISKENKNG